MTTLTTRYFAGTDAFLSERVRAALVVVAMRFLHAESSPDEDRYVSMQRRAYAASVLSSPDEHERAQWAIAASAAPACEAVVAAYGAELAADDVPDALLLEAVALVWDTLAGG